MRSPRLRLAIILSGWVAIVFPGAVRAGFAGTEVFLPSVGRVTGFGGSEFYTTVWITNLSTTTPVNFQFQFLRTGQANTTPLAFSDTLAAGQTKIYENVVESRFGLTAANGAARILTAAGGEVYVSSRIFEQPPGTDLGSSKGLFFSGVPESFGLAVGERASLQGVNQGGAQNLRYNFILLEIGGQPTTLQVDLKDAAGAILGGKQYTLQAYEHRQLNVTDILPSIATTNARLEATVLSGAGRALFAGAQVTNVSQDPTGFEMSFKGSLIATNGTAAGVTSLNGLMGAVTLVPGNNVTITPSGNSLMIAATGGGGTTGAWSLSGNNIIPGYFLGTTNNFALDIRVNDQGALRLEPNPVSPRLIGGFFGNTVLTGVPGATIAGGGAAGLENRITGDFGTVGGGIHNLAGADVTVRNDEDWATVAGGRENKATAGSASIGGGQFNAASAVFSTVSGGGTNTASGVGSTVGGGNGNSANGVRATIAGGRENVANGDAAFVAGQNNRVTDHWGTIAGGQNNMAGDDLGSLDDAQHATVGGGFGNFASSRLTTVGGGLANRATAFTATVGGGQSNIASGLRSTVPGGVLNVAAADASFAVGSRAKANHAGAFVWGDGTVADVASTAANQFVVRASGGTTFYSNGALTAGVTLAPGAGAWSNLSDRNVKRNLRTVDGLEVLERLSGVPMASWSYESQDSSIRHMGPMAQDFRAAFGLGEDDRHISTLDADGVALAAIQALYEIVREKDREIQTLKERLDALERAAE